LHFLLPSFHLRFFFFTQKNLSSNWWGFHFYNNFRFGLNWDLW
jgi:hypothetical protein